MGVVLCLKQSGVTSQQLHKGICHYLTTVFQQEYFRQKCNVKIVEKSEIYNKIPLKVKAAFREIGMEKEPTL
jgi:hypothetical protein